MPKPAERLALLLQVHDDSLRQAAERCGLDHTTLMRVRNGDTENPATLAKIAEGYEVPVSWMRGDRDLPTDFMFGVMARPLQERVAFLWERDRRTAYALRFLVHYAPESFTADRLAKIMQVNCSEIHNLIAGGQGSITGAQLKRLCSETGLSVDWFLTGLVGREDEAELLVGMAHQAVSDLVDRLGADLTQDEIQDLARAMV